MNNESGSGEYDSLTICGALLVHEQKITMLMIVTKVYLIGS